MSHQKTSLKWRTRLFILLLAFAVFPLVGFAMWVSSTLETNTRESTLESLQALARTKAEAVDQFTDYRRNDVERIAGLLAPYLSDLREAEAGPDGAAPAPEPGSLPRLTEPKTLEDQAGDRQDRDDGAPVAGGRAPPSGSAPPTPSDPVEVPADAAGPAQPAAAAGEPAASTGAGAEAAPATPERPAVERARLALQQPLGLILWDQRWFEELLVIDLSGRVVASTFADHQDQSAAALEYFRQGRKATFVHGVFLSPITEQLTMIIATPIRDKNHREIGVLAARLNLARFFRLIGDRTGLGRSDETVVAKQVDSNLVLMAPTRHQPDAPLGAPIPIGSPEATGLQEAVREQSGSGDVVDYRGVRTFAAWQYVPALGWGLLVKFDYAEAMSGVRRLRKTMLLLLAGILVFAVIASVIVSRAFIRPLQKLKDATEKISRGDLDVQLAITSRDEIGQLADSFERMVASIKYYREASARYAAVEIAAGEDEDGEVAARRPDTEG